MVLCMLIWYVKKLDQLFCNFILYRECNLAGWWSLHTPMPWSSWNSGGNILIKSWSSPPGFKDGWLLAHRKHLVFSKAEDITKKNWNTTTVEKSNYSSLEGSGCRQGAFIRLMKSVHKRAAAIIAKEGAQVQKTDYDWSNYVKWTYICKMYSVNMLNIISTRKYISFE